MGKRIEKQNWEEIDKSGWQMTGFLGVNNMNARKILHDYGATVYAVYSIILSHRNTKNNQCFPSVQTIADECGLGKSAVEKSITKLSADGYLDINSGKQGVNNNYYFPKEPFYEDFSNDICQNSAYRRKNSGFKKKKSKNNKRTSEYDVISENVIPNCAIADDAILTNEYEYEDEEDLY